MKVHCWITRFACAAVLAAVVTVVGCGVLTARKTEFAAAVKTADGDTLYVEDVQAIIDDQSLTDADKVAALEELGIEDDDLVQVLMSLPPTAPTG
jgi:hypothetical protein